MEKAGKGRQQVARLRQLLFERRQGCLRLGQRRLLRSHVESGYVAKRQVPALYIEQFRFDFDYTVCCRYLSAQRGFLDGSGHNVGCQCEVSRFELEALELGLGRQ